MLIISWPKSTSSSQELLFLNFRELSWNFQFSKVKYLYQNKYLGWFNYSPTMEMIYGFLSKKSPKNLPPNLALTDLLLIQSKILHIQKIRSEEAWLASGSKVCFRAWMSTPKEFLSNSFVDQKRMRKRIKITFSLIW